MVKTVSSMVPLGTRAQSFSLLDVVNGETIHFDSENTGQAAVIMFICNHCPYVKHVRHQLIQLTKDYQPKNIRFYAINSNDVSQYPDDSPENMAHIATTENYPFPYLFDETQEVAKAYSAACTPDFYVFNQHGRLAYRGQLDDSRPGNNLPVDGKSIREALDCLLADLPIPSIQKPSLGCNIKWKL